MHALDDLIGDGVMRIVSPPRQDVGLGERILGQAVLWFFESGGPDADVLAELAAQAIGDGAMHSLWVDALDRLVTTFVNVLVPDGYAKVPAGRHQIVSASPVRWM